MAVTIDLPMKPVPPGKFYRVTDDWVQLVEFDVGKAILKPEHDYVITSHLVPHLLDQFELLLKGGSPPGDSWDIHGFGQASAPNRNNGNEALAIARATAIASHVKTRLDGQKKRSSLTAPLNFRIQAHGESDTVARTNLDLVRRANPSLRLSDADIEKFQGIFRNARVSTHVIDQKRNVEPIAQEEFSICQVEQVSFNKTFGPGGIAGVAIDILISFEIRDSKGNVAGYHYSGIGPSVGVPIYDMIFKFFAMAAEKLALAIGSTMLKFESGQKALVWIINKMFGEKDAKFLGIARAMLPRRVLDLLEKIWSNGTSVSKQISRGKPFSFRNHGLRRRGVAGWGGEMQVTQYGVITNYPEFLLGTAPDWVSALGNTILNFGGWDVLIPEMRPGYPGHVEGFESGQVLFPGLLQLTSTIGPLRLAQLGEFR